MKADGTDLQVGLRESMRNEWSGDIDFGDGTLQNKHKKYMDYLKFVRGIGCKQRKAYACVRLDLKKQLLYLIEENQFLKEGHLMAKEAYEHKRKLLNVSEDTLFALAWDVEGYSKLTEINESLTNTIHSILGRIDGQGNERGNIAAELCVLRKELEDYVKGLNTKKREAASHLLLFMISDEQRNHKPYAIPVRVLKYKSITDAKLRNLKEDLRLAMKNIGMTTVGMYRYMFSTWNIYTFILNILMPQLSEIHVYTKDKLVTLFWI
jgi:hypothetical protein